MCHECFKRAETNKHVHKLVVYRRASSEQTNRLTPKRKYCTKKNPCWSLTVMHFDIAEFTHCRQSCSGVANILAKLGYQNDNPSSIWMDFPPAFGTGLLASKFSLE
jgi:hypothetical protein